MSSLGMRLAQACILFLISIGLARGLGPRELGVYNYAIAWITLTTTFCQLGLPLFLIREVASHKYRGDYAHLHGILRFADRTLFLATTAAMLLIACAAFLTGSNNSSRETLIAGIPAVFFMANMLSSEAALRGLGHVLLGQVSQLIIRPLTQLGLIVLAIYFLNREFNANGAMLIYTASTLLGYVITKLIRAQKTKNFGTQDVTQDTRIWQSSLVRLTIIGVLGALTTLIGTILLGAISTKTETAFYSLCAQLAMMISIGVIAINANQGPQISSACAANDKENLQCLVTRSCRFSVFVALPVALPMLLFPHALISILYGRDFIGSAPTLVIFAISQLVNSSFGSLGTILVSSHREKDVLLCQGAGLSIQATLSLILIPVYGASGGAVAAAAGATVANLVMFIKVFHNIGVVSFPIGARDCRS